MNTLNISVSVERKFSQGKKHQLMAIARLRALTEPAVFNPGVAKQHARAIAFGVHVISCASF